MPSSKTLSHGHYTIGWICALPLEMAAAKVMLDEVHTKLPQPRNDHNTYVLGAIAGHNVAIACLPSGVYGTTSAAVVAEQMRSTFHSILFGLLVGIGGGVPSLLADIRLGDVVVSKPTGSLGGVVQYDYGKTIAEGRFQRTGALGKPPQALLTALSHLESNHMIEIPHFPTYLSDAMGQNEYVQSTSTYPGQEQDQLFNATYDHKEPTADCSGCDQHQLVPRTLRSSTTPKVHYGVIASANQVMKHGQTRDRLGKELGILCFEMEAAGLMDHFPCVVIRGICDYADSHKNKLWQRYAAMTAAAYAKELLSVVAAKDVREKPGISNVQEALKQFKLDLGSMKVVQFLEKLSQTNQDDYRAKISYLDRDQPRFNWIFKNLDFQKWHTSSTSELLWLSGPSRLDLRQVSSYVVDLEKNRVSKAYRCALYFFCSTVPHHQSAVAIFVRTLLRQYISCLSLETGKQFCEVLLLTLFQRFLARQKFPLKWPEDVIVQVLEEAHHDDLWNALKVAIDNEGNHELSIIVAELDEVPTHGNAFFRGIYALVSQLQEREQTVRILLTSRHHDGIKEIFTRMPTIEHDRERKECLATLRFNNTQYAKIPKEYKGSFAWLWKHPQYQAWSGSTHSRLLFIQGKPGSGKSTLTRYFNANLLQQVPHTESTIIAKFFYSVKEGHLQRSHYNMLQSIVYDILLQHETFFYHGFQSEYRRQSALRETNNGHLAQWDYDSLKELLLSVSDCSKGKKIYLIIDAVDESDVNDRREILELLITLCSSTKNSTIKVFIASRPLGLLAITKFHNLIRLEDHTKSDIAIYTDFILGRVRFDGFLEQAREYITENAQGVFLWVKLIGKDLLAYDEQGFPEEAMFNFLKSLPTELETFYRKILGEIGKNSEWDCQDGIKMFAFILFAYRSLTVTELLHALAVPDHPEAEFSISDESFQKRIPAERRITHCGGNFLEVIRDISGPGSHMINHSEGNGNVQLIHQTVREFFLRPDECVARSQFKIRDREAHIYISITCMRYLMLCVANMARTPQDIREWTSEHFYNHARYLNERPLANYALRYLQRHIDGCSGDGAVQVLATKFVEEGGWVYLHSNGAIRNNVRNSSADVFRHKLLQAAAKNGFASAAGVPLIVGANPNFESKSGQTPLSYAAENGHEAVVKLLTATAGVDVDSKSKSRQTPLSYAAENGHEAVVKLLTTTAGVDVNSRSKTGRTPLSLAAKNGHKEVVELLIRTHGIDVNSEDFIYGQTALSLAARNGHEEVVKLVVMTDGVDVDSKDSIFGRTPLSWGARNGHEAVVKLLIMTEGVDVNSKSITRQTPLSYAAENGHEVVARLLITIPGIQVNCVDSIYGQTPLSLAARNGHVEVVTLLRLYASQR